MAKKARVLEAPSVEGEVHQAEVVHAPHKDGLTRRREQLEQLAGIKNKLFGDSMRVVEDYLRARDVNPDISDPDKDPAFRQMADELESDADARKAYRIAKSGWLPSQDTPGFVKIAANMAIGIMKANAAEKTGTHVLNVGKVIIDAGAVPQFEERESDG